MFVSTAIDNSIDVKSGPCTYTLCFHIRPSVFPVVSAFVPVVLLDTSASIWLLSNNLKYHEHNERCIGCK